MIFIRILFPVFIISLECWVSCSNEGEKSVNQQNVARLARQRYKFNHPPEAENYQAIPVAIFYSDEGTREDKSLEPKVSTSTEKSSNNENLSSIKAINKIVTPTVAYDSDNDIEVKIVRHNRTSNHKEIKLKTHFENVYQIPVAVIYDDPYAASNSKTNNVVNTTRERVRGFTLRKLDDNNEPSTSETKATKNLIVNKSQQNDFITDNQKEHGNRTTLSTDVVNTEIGKNEGKVRDIVNSDQVKDILIEKSYNNSDAKTTNKVAKNNINENAAHIVSQTTETQKEHDNGTALNKEMEVSDLQEQMLPKMSIEKLNLQSKNKESTSVKSDLILEARTDNNDFKSLKVGVETTKSPTENKNKAFVATIVSDIKHTQEQNGNRTSENTEVRNVSNNQRRDRKKEIKETRKENNNVRTTKTDDTANVPKFEKRTSGRDPVVPIIESENRIYSHNGGFQYSYEGGDGTKAFHKGELKMFDDAKTGESVVGSFSYKDKEGNDFSISYTADENGYRPVGAHLPTPPPIPPAIARALRYLATKPTPEPDSDTVTKSFKDY